MDNNEYYKDYYNFALRTFTASVELDPLHRRRNGYYTSLTEILAHSFFRQFEKKFSEYFSGNLETLIRNINVDLGKVSVTIPELAMRDFVSACIVQIKDSVRDETIDVKPKL